MYYVIFLTCLINIFNVVSFRTPYRETMGDYGCQLLQGQRLQAGKPTEIKRESSFPSKPSECFRHQEVASDLDLREMTLGCVCVCIISHCKAENY